MKDKLRAVFDSKTTWLTLGVVAGSLFGETGQQVVNALGLAVMAVL